MALCVSYPAVYDLSFKIQSSSEVCMDGCPDRSGADYLDPDRGTVAYIQGEQRRSYRIRSLLPYDTDRVHGRRQSSV